MFNGSAQVHTRKKKQTRKGQHARAPLRQLSATTPTRRQRANRARHTKGARQNLHSAWFSKYTTLTLGFSTRHVGNTLISSTEKFCAHGTSWQQQWDRELKKHNELRQGSKYSNFNMLRDRRDEAKIKLRCRITITHVWNTVGQGGEKGRQAKARSK